MASPHNTNERKLSATRTRKRTQMHKSCQVAAYFLAGAKMFHRTFALPSEKQVLSPQVILIVLFWANNFGNIN